MEDCIFCKIIKGEIPSNRVYENDNVLAFHDVDKKAPFHVLIIPKKHISSVLELNDKDILYDIFEAAKIIAKQNGIDKTGFRIVANTGKDAGQSVAHLHFHMLGQRELSWPPG